MRKKYGFTLIELLVVIAILAILGLMVMFGLYNNLAKSRDGKRKADLERTKVAMEDYYNDNNEYPSLDILGTCDTDALKPYLNLVPCDPKTKKPYCYIYDSVSPTGQTYRILASFENTNDPIIKEIGCDDPDEYCGFETECTTLVGYSKFNYGVSSSNIAVASEFIGTGAAASTPSPVPLPSSIPGQYACRQDRICRYFDNPLTAPYNCPITWSASNCDNLCGSIVSDGLCAQ